MTPSLKPVFVSYLWPALNPHDSQMTWGIAKTSPLQVPPPPTPTIPKGCEAARPSQSFMAYTLPKHKLNKTSAHLCSPDLNSVYVFPLQFNDAEASSLCSSFLWLLLVTLMCSEDPPPLPPCALYRNQAKTSTPKLENQTHTQGAKLSSIFVLTAVLLGRLFQNKQWDWRLDSLMLTSLVRRWELTQKNKEEAARWARLGVGVGGGGPLPRWHPSLPRVL